MATASVYELISYGCAYCYYTLYFESVDAPDRLSIIKRYMYCTNKDCIQFNKKIIVPPKELEVFENDK